jgi:hypothetical protein
MAGRRSIDTLAAAVGVAGPLGDELTTWLGESRRFRSFVEANRDKIRKKVRTAGDAAAVADVRAELAVARRMVADRRVQLAFEPMGATRGGPDFAVRIGGRAVTLEVTRPRGDPTPTAISRVVVAKARQMPAGWANVLLIATDGRSAPADDIAEGIRNLRARADRKDEAFFTARGYASARAFYEHFLRLGAVLAWDEGRRGAAAVTTWVNPSARIVVPVRALRICEASLLATTPLAATPSSRATSGS